MDDQIFDITKLGVKKPCPAQPNPTQPTSKHHSISRTPVPPLLMWVHNDGISKITTAKKYHSLGSISTLRKLIIYIFSKKELLLFIFILYNFPSSIIIL
jgi:hypothetical protein